MKQGLWLDKQQQQQQRQQNFINKQIKLQKYCPQLASLQLVTNKWNKNRYMDED